MSAAPTVAAVLAYAQRPNVTRRSKAYMQGLEAKLRYLLLGFHMGAVYAEGSAEFDAFHAGADYAQSYIDSVRREQEQAA